MTSETSLPKANSARYASECLDEAWSYYHPEQGGVTETEATTPEYYEYHAAA